ncbi:hypothetical protein GCM10022252_33240 [Streptosporangium oxazolinicum]|uniref:Uncharacterized protein n=1 Tax=Streptosporangium oxazolinicum TaxID=909287 RepID=A0ABP8AWZ3_9ACTN
MDECLADSVAQAAMSKPASPPPVSADGAPVEAGHRGGRTRTGCPVRDGRGVAGRDGPRAGPRQARGLSHSRCDTREEWRRSQRNGDNGDKDGSSPSTPPLVDRRDRFFPNARRGARREA